MHGTCIDFDILRRPLSCQKSFAQIDLEVALTAVRRDLSKVFGCEVTDAGIWSGLLVKLVQLAGDPDKPAAMWPELGTPLGIEESVPLGGVFPTLSADVLDEDYNSPDSPRLIFFNRYWFFQSLLIFLVFSIVLSGFQSFSPTQKSIFLDLKNQYLGPQKSIFLDLKNQYFWASKINIFGPQKSMFFWLEKSIFLV